MVPHDEPHTLDMLAFILGGHFIIKHEALRLKGCEIVPKADYVIYTCSHKHVGGIYVQRYHILVVRRFPLDELQLRFSFKSLILLEKSDPAFPAGGYEPVTRPMVIESEV